jgi:hypothetical protein
MNRKLVVGTYLMLSQMIPNRLHTHTTTVISGRAQSSCQMHWKKENIFCCPLNGRA